MPRITLANVQVGVKVVPRALSRYRTYAGHKGMKNCHLGYVSGIEKGNCRPWDSSCLVDKAAGGCPGGNTRDLRAVYFSRCLRQRIPASRKPSISPLKTDSGLPTSCSVRRSLTIW